MQNLIKQVENKQWQIQFKYFHKGWWIVSNHPSEWVSNDYLTKIIKVNLSNTNALCEASNQTLKMLKLAIIKVNKQYKEYKERESNTKETKSI